MAKIPNLLFEICNLVFGTYLIFGAWNLEIPCPTDEAGRASPEVTPSFFAEFLDLLSPARLSLLDLPTSVGLRYGRHFSSMRSFSWHQKSTEFPDKSESCPASP